MISAIIPYDLARHRVAVAADVERDALLVVAERHLEVEEGAARHVVLDDLCAST